MNQTSIASAVRLALQAAPEAAGRITPSGRSKGFQNPPVLS